MIINLSDDWCTQKRINRFLMLVWIFLAGCLFVKNSFLDAIIFEDIIIGVIASVIPVICLVFLEIVAIKPIMKKIEFSENFISMISSKNKSVSIDLNESVYCEILKLRVGKYKSQDFLILSNEKFETLNEIKGLGKLCRIIDKDSKKIIVPYTEKTILWIKVDCWNKMKQ